MNLGTSIYFYCSEKITHLYRLPEIDGKEIEEITEGIDEATDLFSRVVSTEPRQAAAYLDMCDALREDLNRIRARNARSGGSDHK